jgi:phosphoribosylformylglycinamidine (FGAM) synthase-like enzyme
LAQVTRAERAGNAKNWLSTLALPTLVRPALARLVDASSGGQTGVSEALRNVIAVTDAFLDSAARSELERLSAALGAR